MAEADGGTPSKRLKSSSPIRPNLSEQRIVLLGGNWSERSSVGNFILGVDAFNKDHQSRFKIIQKVENHQLSIINTPDLQFHSSEFLKNCMKVSDPGPHVFLLLLQPEDFTEKQKDDLCRVLQSFTDQSFNHSLILILPSKQPSSGLMENPPLKEMIRKCKYRYLKQENLERSELITRFDQMMKENNGEHVRYEASEKTSLSQKFVQTDDPKAKEISSSPNKQTGNLSFCKEKEQRLLSENRSDMSSGSSQRSEDQFLCSICLEMFTDPVSTPCGHNFCKTCITQHWQEKLLYDCPLCKEKFPIRPQLKVNTLLSEVVSQFRREAQQEASSSSSEQQAARPGEVLCDVCRGTKLKAMKSCLVCLTSYCHTHLEPHLTLLGLRRHQLMEPVENMEDRMCRKHDRPLELFCKTDQTCVCLLCPVLEHKNHKFVPLKEQFAVKKAELGKTEADIQQMIQKRRLKIQELKESVKISKDAADRETAEGVQVFNTLMEAAQRSLALLKEKIQVKQKATEKQAEDLIKDLEQEISELMKRSSEVEQLSRSDDHLHVLQSFSSLKAAPPTKEWTEVRVHPPSYEGTVERAVSLLEETIRKEKLKKFQQYAVNVTLDPKTAHPSLILSDDGKQVHYGDEKRNLPDNPERFSYCVNVLGSQSFSSGRFYFEVQVKGKTHWDLGVARRSINRKGQIIPRPQNGLWTVVLRNGNEYHACADPLVRLLFQVSPRKVGVFVDYKEGLVSFYDVDAATLMFSFTGCCFTEELYPYFSPGLNHGGQNSHPLIICPVKKTV